MSSYRFNPLNNFTPLSEIQLNQYLERIHLADMSLPQEPNLDLLNKVLYAHSQYIPFENGQLRFLDTKPSIDPQLLFDSLVTANRGGYCFQVNTLLLSALRALGFTATPGVARSSVWDKELQDRVLGSTTHMIVFVEFQDRGLYIADMGYNQIGMVNALKVEEGSEIGCAAGEMHRIIKSDITGDGFLVCHKRAEGVPLAEGVHPNGDGFAPLFYFTRERYRPQDYEVLNYFVSHSPVHIMMRSFIASIVTPTGGRAVIVDKKFKRREDARHSHLERVLDMTLVEELVEVMKSEFGIEMSEAEVDGARKVLFSE
ncbi:UNVERIFIED_CONTAM: hypothetical protein HDU68_003538 [Siphonaria sp. JEL0065]|nr:hypothetical protein HDU68_003538 [Siphonaria sp. JEL0065]